MNEICKPDKSFNSMNIQELKQYFIRFYKNLDKKHKTRSKSKGKRRKTSRHY